MSLFKIRASFKPTAEISTFIGDKGQLFYSEDEKLLRISDGVTPAGVVISSANLGSGDGIEGLTADEINQILRLDSGWDFVPTDNDQQSLGAPDKRWKDIYVSGGTIYIGETATIKENTASGSIILPTGSMMETADGTLEPIDTVDLTKIDWTTVLQGMDLGLTYATTAYVDGKVRQSAIRGVQLESGVAATQLVDLIDVGALNLIDGAFLQYNAVVGEWQANIGLADEIVVLEANVTTLQTQYTTLETVINNITNNITNIDNSIDNISNTLTTVNNNINQISLKVDTLPIENLSNVEADAPESGSLLQYNGESGRWQATNNIETTFGTLRLNGGAF
jgi:prefoldin subunit 5